ncbi:MAG: nitroreductase family protein [Desulfovibrio sp.]
MKLSELVLATRTVRRFQEGRAVSPVLLRELVDLARQTASAGNFQPLRYILSSDAATNERIFSRLVWAAYLKDWTGPQPGERPAAYVVVCADRERASYAQVDAGIASQTMLLAARAEGLGGCMLGAVDRDGLRAELDIPESVDILYVLALGEPAEEVVLEPLSGDGSVQYWRDAQGVHHVPKRGLDELILAAYDRETVEKE